MPDPNKLLAEQLLHHSDVYTRNSVRICLLCGLSLAVLLGVRRQGFERQSGRDLDGTTLGMRSHLALSPVSMGRAPMPSAVAPAQHAQRVLPVAAQSSTENTAVSNWPAQLAAAFGAVGAGLAVDVGLESAGVPEEPAKALVLMCGLGVTYGIAIQRFGGDPWEHSAEMMARTEAGLLGPTSEQPPLVPTAPGPAAYAALKDQGVVRLDSVLSSESAAAARSTVIQRLDTLLSDWEVNKKDRTKFGAVTCRKSRYDVLLQPDGGAAEAAVRDAMAGPLGELMEAAVGFKAQLQEFGALISDEGAGRQPLQLKTAYQAEAPMYTAVIALQDESIEIGPTLFMTGTHTQAAFDAFVGGDIKKSDLLRGRPFVGSMLRKGDCAVFDSRLLHADAVNIKGRRAMLYFSFARPGANITGALADSRAPDTLGRHCLEDFLAKK
eukprot:gnl/TRDRNA2_/TRDRNA2_193486_c0_seq1.p1 gnl/TRDRNA2_/TRDRNA2_193486_c0~~gnl/TRDRNA2_/TRDRNA2_193486_c0_seq1.p1  ORF type:complete len:437 (+),score=80.91 gnl/TRDRNA2_/TRDRNA2_193486_c0_seq1:63-1373(+)